MTKRLAYFLVSAVLVGAVAVASPALADLNPGESQFKDDPGLPGPIYVHGTPGWFSGVGGFGNGVSGTMSSAITGGISGTVMSEVFDLGGGGFGFAYEIDIASTPGAVQLVNFQAIPAWQSVRISAFHSAGDGVGTSAPGGAVAWADGDPLSASRDIGTGALGLTYHLRALDWGTKGESGDTFARFFFAAPDLTSWSSSELHLLDGAAGTAQVFTIPAPGAVLLGAIGLGAVGLLRRRFAR